LSLNRYAAKSDLAQSPIVSGLRKCGYRVEIIRRPTDLLVSADLKWWRLLEVKKKAGFRRKDQPSQNLFIDQTRTPVVSTLEEALEALK